jgi:hypothetical protein
MLGNGLETQVEPFPEIDKAFSDSLVQLRQLDPKDLKAKLVIGGFLNHPYGPEKQQCLECMYYFVPPKMMRFARTRRSGRTGSVVPVVANLAAPQKHR